MSLDQILDSDCILQQCLVEVLNDEAEQASVLNKEDEAKRIIAEMRGHG